MDENSTALISSPQPTQTGNEPRPSVRSLKELIDVVTGRKLPSDLPQEDSGLAEAVPFPFMGIVGQKDMKLALLLAVINPAIGGVLLIGPRGTGKTTAVRSLLNLLPEMDRSACYYGCLPEDIDSGGIDVVCPDCARKFGEGLPLTRRDPVRLVELPLNSQLEDVIGGLDERALIHERLRLKRGILAQADLNILYADEVNLLAGEIIDAILDAAAQGTFTVHRGPNFATYKARFTLFGSMNPEEGSLRPQIMDRFGLRVVVRGLQTTAERKDVYERVRSYRQNQRAFIAQYDAETQTARAEIESARRLLPSVTVSEGLVDKSIQLIRRLQIDSLRAEITLLEAARACAAADNRTTVEQEDIETVAPMALRLRSSEFMNRYFEDRLQEDKKIFTTMQNEMK